MLSVLAPLAPMSSSRGTTHHRTQMVRDREASPSSSTRTVPIVTPTLLGPTSPDDTMDVTTPTNASAPGSSTKSPNDQANSGAHTPISFANSGASGTMQAPAPAAAAAAVHTPKIVQTAFIHKLYNMLEDPSIQHLISWSNTQESFVMAPTNDFSKVLAQYFKHTNISSFVRQLNMYGFHKVSDVFHNGSPETTLWEFKHGNGNFKRGDLVGLREIRRRASRHALVHRDFNSQKPTPPQPGTPAEPMLPPSDAGDPRMAHIEHALYDLGTRLERSESNSHYMHLKQQAMNETLARVLQFNQELSRTLLNLVPNPEDPVHRDVLAIQSDVQRQADVFRAMDEPHDTPYSTRTQYFPGVDNAPVSPRQLAQDDVRRSSLAVPQPRPAPYPYRPQISSNLSVNTRRPYGSIGGASLHSAGQASPNSLRPFVPPPPPQPHPLASVEPPPGSLLRRHTSADIRDHGWQPQHPPPPMPSGPLPGGHWPSSPSRGGGGGGGAMDENYRIRESFSTYSLQSSSHHSQSRPMTPPSAAHATAGGPITIGGPFGASTNGTGGAPGLESLNSWSWNSAEKNHGRKNNLGNSLGVHLGHDSAPSTRRGSMAHILNPTDTAERDDEMEDEGFDDRKRKRMV